MAGGAEAGAQAADRNFDGVGVAALVSPHRAEQVGLGVDDVGSCRQPSEEAGVDVGQRNR
jgi:hypothetical protein